jgi:hypothetical protein
MHERGEKRRACGWNQAVDIYRQLTVTIETLVPSLSGFCFEEQVPRMAFFFNGAPFPP